MIEIAILIVCTIVLAIVWIMDFIFNMIEIKHNHRKRKIEQVGRFIDRNKIKPEEAELLYELLLH